VEADDDVDHGVSFPAACITAGLHHRSHFHESLSVSQIAIRSFLQPKTAPGPNWESGRFAVACRRHP
jgi:hypothetical protein